MIGRDELAEAARYLDAFSSEHEFERVGSDVIGVDVDGMAYVAHQRALRAAMLIDGQDPRQLSRTEPTEITLSPEAEALLVPLTALAMDCIAISLYAARKQDR